MIDMIITIILKILSKVSYPQFMRQDYMIDMIIMIIPETCPKFFTRSS